MERQYIGTIDLTAVARVLRDSKRHQQVVDAINLTQSYHAAVMDLERARRLLERFKNTAPVRDLSGPSMEQDTGNSEALGALFQLAIVMYSRATSDGSKTRRKIQYRDMLFGEDLQQHNRLIAVRDKAIAHVDATDHFTDGPWSTGDLVWRIDSHGISNITYYYMHANYRQNVVDDLESALLIARILLSDLRNRKSLDLHPMLEQAMSDPHFAELARMHPKSLSGGDREISTLNAHRPRGPLDV